MAAVNEELLDAAVRHQIHLGRYATGLVRRIIAVLNETDADIVDQIIKVDPTGAGGSWSLKRLNRLLEDIRAINSDAYKLLRQRARQELGELAVYEADFQARVLRTTIKLDLNITQPTRQMLVAVVNERPIRGALLKDWVAELSRGRQRQVESAIRIGLVEGETIDQIVKRVRGTRALQFKDSALALSRRHTEAFVRTAVNHTATGARELLYQENNDLMKGVKWVSTLDGRTTPVCRARDGKVYPVNAGPRPPAHIGCRSATSPIVKSWEELGFSLGEMDAGTRASMDGQVPADLTYGPWLKRQPVEFVDDVLGKTRSQLFRKGDLAIDKFVDDKGRPYTLDELRQWEAGAFADAHIHT